MLKNLSRLECKIEDRIGYFLCDIDTSLPIAKEMLFQFLKYIGQVEDAANAQQSNQPIEEVKTEIYEETKEENQQNCC